jgi:O-antigen ligase
VSALAFDLREAPRRARLPIAVVVVGLLLGTLAVVRPPLAIALSAGAIFVGLAVYELAAAVAFFATISFFEAIPGIPGSGISTKLAGGVLVIGWLLVVLRRDRTKAVLFRDRPILAYVTVAFWGWTAVSALWATDTSKTISVSLRLLQGIVFLFVVYTAVTRARHVRWVMWGLMAGAVITGLVGLLGATKPESFSPYSDTSSRLSGQIGDANEFAAALIPALAFAVFMVATTRKPLTRWALWSFALLFALGIFLTGSRGGLVGLGVMLLAGLVFGGRLRPRVFVATVLVVTLGTVYYTLFASPEALQRVTHFTSGGGTGRIDIWSVAATMWRDHPGVGVGYGNFTVLEPTYAARALNIPQVGNIVDTPLVVHNLYLHLLVELGVVGLVLFVLLLGGALLSGLRAARVFARVGDVETELLARASVIGALGLLASYTFLSAQSEKQLWLILGLLTALLSVAARQAGGPTEQAVGAEYDLDVREQRVAQRERRLVEQMDALRAEGERLARRRAGLAAEEERIRRKALAVAESPVEAEEDVQRRAAALMRERDEAREGLAELGQALEAAGTQAARLERDMNEAAARAQAAAEREERLGVRIAELERSLESALADAVAFREASRREARRRERHVNRVAELDRQHKLDRAAIAELEHERDAARAEANRLEQELSALGGGGQGARSRDRQLAARLAELLPELEALRAQVADLEQARSVELARLRDREQKLKSRIARLAAREREHARRAAELDQPGPEQAADPEQGDDDATPGRGARVK